ncbi:MUS81 [Branchiostoma lanceolatum]|uniref:Crossover junction endonuclease MUS81 n=1 Tax=Branchiostoma lanceolatum TaxID=7740 RepID=A0A8K0EUB9_BRALA|nr:MUS81 [Branchiostoma lanceolatum]
MAAKMNKSDSQYGRKKKVDTNPNPLFLQWLTEWADEAEAKGRTKLHFTFLKAIKSLKKYPLPLQSGKEAKILDFVGDKICKMLDDKLAKHIQEHGPFPDVVDTNLPSTSRTDAGVIRGSLSVPPPPGGSGNSQGSGGEPRPKKRKQAGGTKEYVPAFRSGPYALLVTLYRNMQNPDSRGFMARAELQREAQPLCDKSFTLPDPGSHYTAWSSMGGLVKKGLVIKDSNPAKYYITDKGSELAHKLELIGEQGVSGSSPQEDSEDMGFILTGPGNAVLPAGLHAGRTESCIDVTSLPSMDVNPNMRRDVGQAARETVLSEMETDESQGSVTSRSKQPLFTLSPGEFEVVLCVDTQETTGGAAGSRKVNLVPELQKNSVRCDVRNLHVGDFLWVAREKVKRLPGQLHPPLPRELVLDYVVERKRMDDLASSIKGSRFKEQKFRLKMSGLRKPIYLVEDFGSSAAHFCLPEATLQQAVVNTQVTDGFFVKRTADMKESVTYLTLMTHYLQSLYAGKTLKGYSREDLQDQSSTLNLNASVIKLLPFPEFNETSVKNKVISVKEMFAKQLMQFHGMSKEKVAAVVNTYPTPVALLQSYSGCGSAAEKERMLAPLKYGHTKRNLGPALSKAVFQLYCSTSNLQ